MRLRLLAGVVLAGVMSISSPSRADDSPKDEAVQLYGQGRDFLAVGKPADALPLLIRSLQLLPSPNTELLIAHAHRDLGKKAQALDDYERARRSAQAQVDKGQIRYTDTVSEASRSAADLLKDVGAVDVKGPPGGAITVHRPSGDDVTLRSGGKVFADPGEVLVSLRSPTGQQQKKVTVRAGEVVEVTFADVSTPTPPSDKRPGRSVSGSGSPFGVVTVAGAVAGGVGLAGFGLFAGFGTSAKSKYDDLAACTDSTCPYDGAQAEALRTDGKREQLVANASLGIGAVLVAGGAILIIIDALNGPDEPATQPRSVEPILAIDVNGAFGGVNVAF